MNPQPPNLDDLRANLHRAQLPADRLRAFSAILFHPDALWSDILAGLDESPAIAEVAAVWLHVQLNVPHRGVVILDKTRWLALLEQAGRSPSERVEPK